jgi:hypothetical protein
MAVEQRGGEGRSLWSRLFTSARYGASLPRAEQAAWIRNGQLAGGSAGFAGLLVAFFGVFGVSATLPQQIAPCGCGTVVANGWPFAVTMSALFVPLISGVAYGLYRSGIPRGYCKLVVQQDWTAPGDIPALLNVRTATLAVASPEIREWICRCLAACLEMLTVEEYAALPPRYRQALAEMCAIAPRETDALLFDANYRRIVRRVVWLIRETESVQFLPELRRSLRALERLLIFEPALRDAIEECIDVLASRVGNVHRSTLLRGASPPADTLLRAAAGPSDAAAPGTLLRPTADGRTHRAAP